jgi:excisionase family DNA binding protein
MTPTATTPVSGFEELLTVGEVAGMLRLHPQTVRTMAVDGRLRKVPIGKRSIRITGESVSAFIAGCLAAAS